MMLPMPKLRLSLLAISAKNDKVATAVMISGTISGRLMIMKAVAMPRQGLTRVMPITAKVAVMVETTVATMAIVMVLIAAL